MIEIEGLCKQYGTSTGSIVALHNVNLRVQAGERLGLFGPSGSGKTTLLRCIAGLEAPEEGVIRIGGVEVYDARAGLNLAPWMRPIGVVFQDFALWPHMRVLDNVMFPLRYGRANSLNKAEQRERAMDTLRRVRLEGFAERFPSELSGGQRQRVALARALVSQPRVLLMDEPLNSLDPHLRKQTRNELVDIFERAGITTIFVSHDHVDGLFMTHNVGVMRDGRLVQTGPPVDVFMRPLDASVAETLDVGSLLECRRESLAIENGTRYRLAESDQFLLLPESAWRPAVGETCLMLIRTSACRLLRDPAGLEHRQSLVGTVIREAYTGQEWCVLVSLGGVTIEVREPERPGLRFGDAVELTVDVRRVQLLPTPGDILQ